MTLEAQDLRILPLVRFDFPEVTVGYHVGGRPFDYGGLEYRPNKYLSVDSFASGMENAFGDRSLVFSGVPDEGDPIAKISDYTWKRAFVTVTFLAGAAGSDVPLSVITTQFYRIESVNPTKSAADENGRRTVTIELTLEPEGARVSGQAFAKASNEDQQFDNLDGDTFFEDVAVEADWERRWGQRVG